MDYVNYAASTSHGSLSCRRDAEIDKIVSPGKRTAFLVEIAHREIKLNRQRNALREATGAWSSEEHPELTEVRPFGSARPVSSPSDGTKRSSSTGNMYGNGGGRA